MPTIFSHAIAATAIGAVMVSGPSRTRIWALGALCAMVPDLDVIPFRLGVPYHHMLGHRGLSHSLLFAAVLASLATALVLRKWPASARGPGLWAFFFVATASHGVLDAMTTGGFGVAFFAPFSDARYFLPWRPIVVSQISVRKFFSHDGLMRMWSELGWVWLPATMVFLAGLALHRRGRKPGPPVATPPGRPAQGERRGTPGRTRPAPP